MDNKVPDLPLMRDFEAEVKKTTGIDRSDCLFCIKCGNDRMQYGAKCKTCPVARPCRVHNIIVNKNDNEANASGRREYAAFITMCKEYFQKHIK
jgi:hypothetical protein